MPGLSNVTVGDTYGQAQILDVWNARGGWLTVGTHPVIFQLQYGKLGEPYFTDEQQLGIGAFVSLPSNATGIRLRNATPGSAAVVNSFIYQGDEPVLSVLGTGQISSST